MTAYEDAEARIGRPSAWAAFLQNLTELAAFLEAARRAERLLSLGDAELSRRGLRREDVVSHAFRDCFEAR
jgi:hypothetical protein